MKTRITIYTLLCAALLGACYEDKGHYDYIQPNAVSISFLQGSTISSIPIGKPYRINPILEFSNPRDTAGFDYLWIMEEDTIGRERDLTYTFGKSYSREPLLFCARDPHTGYTSFAEILITSVSELSKGWVILSRGEDGRSVLGFIRPVKATGQIERSYEPYPDLYATLHPGDPLGSGPVSLGQIFNSNSSRLSVLQEEGSVYLDGDYYEKDIPLNMEFIGGEYPAGFVPKKICNSYTTDGLLGRNGELFIKVQTGFSFWQFLYHSKYPPQAQRYGNEALQVENISIANVMNSNMIYAYEKSKKRVMCIGNSNMSSGVVLPVKGNGGVSGFTALDNLGDYEVIWQDRMGYGNFTGVMMLKNGNNYRLQCFATAFDFMGTSCTVSSWPAPKVADFTSEHLSANSVFKMLFSRPYFFFAEKGKLYWYDMNTKTIKLFYDFGSRNVVRIGHNPQQSELGVALDSGEFVLLDIQDSGLTNANILYQTSGFGDIVDMIYKFENSGSYTGNQAD